MNPSQKLSFLKRTASTNGVVPTFPIIRGCTLSLFLALVVAGLTFSRGQNSESEPEFPNAPGCTSIMIGRLATTDGSVITSHTVDGSYRTWMDVSPHRTNAPAAKTKIYTGRMFTRLP